MDHDSPEIEHEGQPVIPTSDDADGGGAPEHDSSGPARAGNLDVILDIRLPLEVRFGRTEMALQALSQLGPGSVIDLDRMADDPVEVLVNGKMIARGEVVVVSGNYGVRITQVLSADDRIRMMGW